MYQILVRYIGRYAPIVTFPIAVVLGIIGYNLESVLITKQRPTIEEEKGITQEREDRLLEKNKELDIFTQRNNIFDKNDKKHLRK